MIVKNKTDIKPEILIRDIRILRIILITYTSSIIIFIVSMFINDEFFNYIFNSPLNIFPIIIINFVVVGIFKWYNWYTLPISQKEKKENQSMMFWTGIIGMWLWLPNKKEIKKMIEKVNE